MLASFLNDAERNARSMEKAHINALKSADAARYVDLGEKTLKVIKEGIPRAYRKYEELLKGEQGILKSDVGRFHAQDSETVDIIMRYAAENIIPVVRAEEDKLDKLRIDFGVNERNQRARIVEVAVSKLRENTGAVFSPESKNAKAVEQNAAWASRAWEAITQRNALLEGYLEVKLKGANLEDLPTMEEEIQATIHRRMVTLEESLNEVEREADKERGIRLVQVTREIEAGKLNDQIAALRALAEEKRKYDAAIAKQREQEIEIAAAKKLQSLREEMESEMTLLRERQVELEKELATKALEIDKIVAEKETMEKKLKMDTQLRAMPADAKVLVSILTAPGFWAPGEVGAFGSGGRFFRVTDSRYDRLKAGPHSLSALAAAGALTDDANGYLSLYLILAGTGDKDRPRLKGAIEVVPNGSQVFVRMPSAQISSVFTQNQKTKDTLKKIQAIQAVVRNYGEQMVKEGLLAP